MFLKLFEPIFASLGKNVKLTLLALLLAVLLAWGGTGEYRIKKQVESFAEERKSHKDDLKSKDIIIAEKDEELRDVRNRLFNYVMREKETQTNDSILRKTSNKDINKILP